MEKNETWRPFEFSPGMLPVRVSTFWRLRTVPYEKRPQTQDWKQGFLKTKMRKPRRRENQDTFLGLLGFFLRSFGTLRLRTLCTTVSYVTESILLFAVVFGYFSRRRHHEAIGQRSKNLPPQGIPGRFLSLVLILPIHA